MDSDLEEIAKLPKDAQRRVLEAIGNLVSEMDPKLKDLATKVAMARHNAMEAGDLETIPIEEATKKAWEHMDARIKQSTSN